jgi:hypothetical protein
MMLIYDYTYDGLPDLLTLLWNVYGGDYAAV